mmetsp:Transcript_36034/g.41416  ORF Transcript_36034/g.41416 Transcript_36034/m.41416 type:complete len:92 (-) Transcript_36034:478-753(-)
MNGSGAVPMQMTMTMTITMIIPMVSLMLVMMLMIGWGLLEYHDESESTFLSIEDITAVPYSVVLQTTEVVPMAMAMSMVIIQTTLPACEIE